MKLQHKENKCKTLEYFIEILDNELKIDFIWDEIGRSQFPTSAED